MLDAIMSQLTSFVNLMIENYIVSAIVISAVVGIVTFVILTRRHKDNKPSEAPEPPKPMQGSQDEGRMRNIMGMMRRPGPAPGMPKPVPPADTHKKETMMGVARDLERQLNRIDITNASEEHRKWYNQLKMRIEKTKMAINEGDFKSASRNISGAEMYLKLIVLNSV